MISLVSGTYNRLKSLQAMIRSVRQSVGDLPYEIIIVDVGSTDGSREWLQSQEDVLLIEHEEPTGSAAAFQDGFSHAQGKYVVTLNDDIVVNDDTIRIAHDFLDRFPDVGQVAFAHMYQNRDNVDSQRRIVQKAFGYVYGQCCMTRKWLGDKVNWCWSDREKYVHYGWDNALSMKIWELGYRCVEHPECSVTDFEIEDVLRETFSKKMRDQRGHHTDTKLFTAVWKGRLPRPDRWIPASVDRILWLAARRQLRTLRFKATMLPGQPMRRAMIDAFAAYGPTWQVNRTTLVKKHGHQGFQRKALEIIDQWKPDLVLTQTARMHNAFLPGTFDEIRRRFPNVLLVNWEADPHVPLLPFHYQIAAAADFHFTISPDLIHDYERKGVYNVGFWPIGVEHEYLKERKRGPFSRDVVFLGSSYPNESYPEAKTRNDAVIALARSGLSLGLYGHGWKKFKLSAQYSGEQHEENAQIYAESKLALSVSQVSTLQYYTSDRLYNICGPGCPALVHRFKGMEGHGFVDGETCIVWDTVKEMVEKAKWYIAHDTERERIGRNGRELILSRHTWPHRVEEFFRLIGGLC